MHTEPSGTGPASWVVLVSAGQEAFDSFARPRESGFRRCETAVKPGDTTWTGVPSKANGETPDHKVVRRSAARRARERRTESLTRRNGAPQGAL